jgi:Peptidase family M48
MNTKDYILISAEEADGSSSKKKILAKVMSVDDGAFTARLEVFPHLDPKVIEFSNEQVFLNLGPKPPVGSVYGVSIKNLFVKTLNLDGFGPIHFFCKPTKEDLAELKKAVPKFVHLLQSARLDFLLEENTSLEVVSKASTRYAGLFTYYKNHRRPSRIQLTVDSGLLKKIGTDSLEYVLAHEFGHALHFHHVREHQEIEAAWIKLYTKCTSAVTFDVRKARSFLKTAVKLGSLRALKKTFEGDADLNAELRQVLHWISSKRGINAKDLELLISNGDIEELKEVWPTTDLSVNRKTVTVTEYACKNYRELFAEAFALKLTGKKLAKEVDALLSKTISFVLKNRPV